ncbi:hypothetical protein BDN71DRAFT_1487170 [Pleurotus eryngii]|uniref:Zn(2)-C6 fungal-type domain-containing protein n=1 Tax=Pleurotus eryngii TaxID=5323 RepID=A0A9P6A5N1_PLEER|nr:hypothetical protein BDN71DRAFT_1487170 [Pleurotus eryngii]
MASSSSPREEPSTLVMRTGRRNRGALSCAECRRLKLKCSRVFPCSNCVKKGCSAICPDGSLTTGKGNRFVLANTEALHDKIGQLAQRVRELEDALQEAHSRYSSERHQLLSDELLQIKRPLEREVDASPIERTTKVDQADAVDAMGHLSISQKGRTTFFGTAANAWLLLQNEAGSDGEDTEEQRTVFEFSKPAELPWLSFAFPFAPPISKTTDSLRGAIYDLLPQQEVAQRFCKNYFRHAAWMYEPITEVDFYERIYRPMYGAATSSEEPMSSHDLAVLCMVLALGSLLDLDKPIDVNEHSQLYQLGRAALSLDSVFEQQSIAAIQALLIMCHYMFLSHIEGPRWAIMGLVVKLAHSLGLHRDGGQWNLDDVEGQKRRCLLWEIYVYDSWQSLTFGRPPSFALCHIDTKMPFEKTRNEKGDVEMTFAAWKHRFASECQSHVQDQAFGARPISYKRIQELDKSVRDFYIPPSLQVPGFMGVTGGDALERPTVELTMQRYIAFAIKEITIFYMHRGFFARALEECPEDPMGSKYAASVLAAYTSACSFVGLIQSLYQQHPILTERMWFLFTHVFSCTIVLGSIAAKTPMALAPSALSHLETATNLFSQVEHNPRAQKVLPILRKLTARAYNAAHPNSPLVKQENDVFAGLSGKTRLISRRTPSSPSSPSHTSSPTSQPASPPPQSTQQPLITQSSWPPYNAPLQNFGTFSPNTSYSLSPQGVHPQPQQQAAYTYATQQEELIHFQPSPAYYASMSGDPINNTRINPYWQQTEHVAQTSSELFTPHEELNSSWQNLMSQWK